MEQLVILRHVMPLEIIEELATAAGHLEKPAAGMEVLAMGAQVLGQMVDPGGEQRDLDLARAGVLVVMLVVLDDLLLLSHGINLPYESGVPLQVTVRATHMISVADRI